MNFDSQTPVDILLGRLLAFIIMFEKKIQFIKCKLAGNQQFHTRLAFQILDVAKKNQISADNIYYRLQQFNHAENVANCQFFIRRYSQNNGLTYEEFLKLITPKSNKILSQRMMIRTYRRGAVLQEYLMKHLLDLLNLYIKMSVITETLRRSIQQNQDINHLQVIQFFHQRIYNSYSLINFLNQCGQEDEEQFDIQPPDAIYLTYHIKSGNQINEFTDFDIKEIVCPIDMNFQKTVTKDLLFKQTGFSKQARFNQTKTTNFLGKTYQKIHDHPHSYPSQIKQNRQISGSINNNGYVVVNTNRQGSKLDKSNLNDSYGGLFVDNFVNSGIHQLQINKYVQYKDHIHGSGPKQVIEYFHDDLSNRSGVSDSSKGSAFDRN